MFVLVAVEMTEAQEVAFQPWVAMRHCKQISVSIRTGSRLVQIFKEGLMNRVLQSDATSTRFYNAAPGAAYHEEGEAVAELTSLLVASLPPPPMESLLRLQRNDSRNVSRCGSEEDDTELWRDQEDLDVFDMCRMSPRRSPMGPPPGWLDERALEERAFQHVSGLIVDEIAFGGRYFQADLQPTSQPGTPAECLCPISHELMTDPVVCSDGHTYDRKGIETWFRQGKQTSPLTGAVLTSKNLVPNHALRSLIESLIVDHHQIIVSEQ